MEAFCFSLLIFVFITQTKIALFVVLIIL